METIENTQTPTRPERDVSPHQLLDTMQIQANLQRDRALEALSSARRVDFICDSDAYARQNCLFFMQAIGSSQGSSVVRASVSQFSQIGSDLATSYQLEPVSTHRAALYSDVPFAKDEWVYIRAGIETHNDCFANDVRVDSSIYTRWYLRSVLVGPAS